MKALVWNGEKIELTERPFPVIQHPRDAIVKVTLSSVCTSDLHIIRGFVPKAKEGIVLGHEFVGEIIELGSDIKNLQIGDRVSANCETFCGECYFCKHGFINNCENGGWMLGCTIDTALALRWDSSGIWVLGETGLSILSPSGEVTGYAGYGGLYLKDFSLTGDGTAALLLGRYRAGTDSQLWTVSPDGTTRAALPVEEQVLSLSAAGRYVGLLTADRLDVYDQNLEPYSTLEGTQGAQKVLQQADGSAMLIANAAAWLYLPQ